MLRIADTVRKLLRSNKEQSYIDARGTVLRELRKIVTFEICVFVTNHER